MAEPAPAPTTPRLLISCAGKMWSIDLTVDTVSIGRSRANTIRLTDKSISAHHCEIAKLDDRYVLIDNGAKNNTLLNGKPVSQAALCSGDVLSIGNATIRFEAPEKKMRAQVGPLRRLPRQGGGGEGAGDSTAGPRKVRRPTPRLLRTSTAMLPSVRADGAEGSGGGGHVTERPLSATRETRRPVAATRRGVFGSLFSGSVASYLFLTLVNLVIVAALIWRLATPAGSGASGPGDAKSAANSRVAPARPLDPEVPPPGLLRPVAAAPGSTPGAAPAAAAAGATPATAGTPATAPAPSKGPLEPIGDPPAAPAPAGQPAGAPAPGPANPVPAPGESAPGPAPTEAASEDEPTHDRSIEFLGLHEDATHYLFVVDASGSMDEPSPSQPGIPKREVVRQALVDSIQKLDPAQSFSVVFFSDESFAMSSRFVRATNDCKGVAVNWVNAFKRKGATNIWSGIERAFEIAATVPEKERSDPAFRICLIVLSDGRVKEPARVIDAVRAYVKGKKMTVSTISFDPRDAALEQLASAGGGTFVRR